MTIRADVDEPGVGTFSADGDNVCSEGWWATLEVEDSEVGTRERSVFRTQFVCDDGSGVFYLNGEVDFDPSAPEEGFSGTWELQADGVGDYRRSTGSGAITGQLEPVWFFDFDGVFEN